MELYQAHGIDGIKRRNTKAVYDTDFKLSAVKQLLLGKSLTNLTIALNLPNHSMLASWLKSYQSFGIMGLTPKPKGRKAVSNSNQKNKAKATSKTKPNWQSKQDHEKSVDDLLSELAYLRAENDYLKKYNALIQQEQECNQANKTTKKA